MEEAKWKKLLKDPNFRRWYENLSRGSQGTATERARVLYRYLRGHKLTPANLVAKALKNRRSVEDQLQDFVAKLEREGKAPGYIVNYIKAVKSWLDFNEIRLVRKIKVRDSGVATTLQDERVPTKEELRSILSGASMRERVIISFIAFSGLRPQVLGNDEGLDGLKVKDLSEMKVDGSRIVFEKIPTRVTVRRELSKARHRYFTFLPTEGCDYLQVYLESRLAAGEKLDSDTPIIAVAPGYERMGRTKANYGSRFIVTRNIAREIRDAMRPRFKWRPYVLRAYFDTQLMIAESQGKISHTYRQFFMGHKGDIEAQYTTNKGRLPPNAIEELRRTYKESEMFLTTIPAPLVDVKDMLLESWREQAKAYGIDPMRIRIEKQRKQNIELRPEEEIHLLTLEIAKRAAPQSQAPGTVFTNDHGRKNKIIKGDKRLVSHLNRGWELVNTLGHGKFLIRQKAS